MTAHAKHKTRDMVYIALFAVLTAVCAWISVPALVPFTMQTFALFLSVGVLGGRRGSLTAAVYLLMGAAGMPVFSHFTGGLGVLLSVNGGYLLGFLAAALVMWAAEALWGRGTWALAASMALGLLACYAFGTVWFMAVYAPATGAVGVGTALVWCVLPYILPDLAKLAMALTLTRRLRAALRL